MLLVHCADSDDEAGESITLRPLVDQVEKGEVAAVEQLYELIQGGMQFYIARVLPPDRVDYTVRSAFLDIIDKIQAGNVSEPDAFLGLVRAVVGRHVAQEISVLGTRRTEEARDRALPRQRNPVDVRKWQEQVSLMKTVLTEFSSRDQEALHRLYCENQSKDEICEAMNLTPIEFRLLKSKARSRFVELRQSRPHKKHLFARVDQNGLEQYSQIA